MPAFSSKVAKIEDKPQIVEMVKKNCAAAPGGILPEENFMAIIDPVLNDPDYGFFILASDDKSASVGLMFFSHEFSDWRSGLFFWLQSFYAENNNDEIFSSLLAAADAHGKSVGYCGFRL